MYNNEKSSQVSKIISDLAANQERITISEIIDALQDRGLAILMAIFVLPVAVPLPAPVLATILGLPILFLSLQLMVGKEKIWLPSKVLQKDISCETLLSAAKYLKKIEYLLHYRLGFMTSRVMHPILGVFCVIFSLTMMLPFPLTNTVPGFSILLISLGLFERDGIFVLLGGITGIVWISLLLLAGDELVAFVSNLL